MVLLFLTDMDASFLSLQGMTGFIYKTVKPGNF